MERPEKKRAIGKEYATEIYSSLPLKIQLILSEVSRWLPQLEKLKNGAWRPLVVGVLACHMAACQPTRGFEDQPPPSPTPIVEPYHLQPTPELIPSSPPEPTPTPEPTPIATPGPTISGETLTISDSQLKLKEFDGEEIAQLINASEKGWQVITNDKGKVSFFSGEVGKEPQIVVLAQGPEEYQFDYKNQLWRGENNQVFIPDILLPGGWNEAGIFFLIKDIKDNGYYKVGAIYPPDKVAQISDKSNLEILPDGSGLFVGSPKNYELKEGQKLIRDEDGNLRLTNADGSYLLMKTSWSQVTSPNQLYQAGTFAGPFETQPTLPYPTDEIVQELGITNYQVVDNHYIALQEVVDQQTGETRQYIIAQAITNKEGEFTGWQRTLPFDVESGLVVPHPQETNPELFDLKKSDAPIPQFVKAMEMAGIKLDSQEVANNLQYQTITGADGQVSVYEMYPVKPGSPLYTKNEEGPINQFIPLFVAEQKNGKWLWHTPSLYSEFQKAGIPYTGALIERDFDGLKNQFNLQTLGVIYSPNSTVPSNLEEINYRLGVGRNKKIPHLLALGELCSHRDNLMIADEDLQELITARLKQQFDSRQIPYRIVINEYHEMRNGVDIKKCFQLAKKADPNIKLIFLDTDNHYSKGMWTNRFKDQLKNVRDFVDIVGVQSHAAQWDWQLPILPTSQDIASTLRSYGKPIWVIEFDVDGDHRNQLSPLEKFMIAYTHIRGFLESGVVEAINFWSTPEDDRGVDASQLFYSNEKPHLMYYAVQKAIIDYLLSQQQLK